MLDSPSETTWVAHRRMLTLIRSYTWIECDLDIVDGVDFFAAD